MPKRDEDHARRRSLRRCRACYGHASQSPSREAARDPGGRVPAIGCGKPGCCARSSAAGCGHDDSHAGSGRRGAVECALALRGARRRRAALPGPPSSTTGTRLRHHAVAGGAARRAHRSRGPAASSHHRDALAGRSESRAPPRAHTGRDRPPGYETLVVATGARSRDGDPGRRSRSACRADAPARCERVLRAPWRAAELDRVRRLRAGPFWPLPLYELALMTARHVGRARVFEPAPLVTPSAPRSSCSASRLREIATLLERDGVELGGRRAVAFDGRGAARATREGDSGRRWPSRGSRARGSRASRTTRTGSSPRTPTGMCAGSRRCSPPAM